MPHDAGDRTAQRAGGTSPDYHPLSARTSCEAEAVELPDGHHAWSAWRYCCAPTRRFGQWFTDLADSFGWRFVVLVVFAEHLLKGFLGGGGCSGGFLVIEGMAYLQLQVGASTKSMLMAVSGSAWSLKPIFGMISDTLVICKYRRSPWIIITSVLACAGYITIFCVGRALGPAMLCLCFFLARMQNAWTDLMVEATYTEKMKYAPQHASDILTWVWSGIGVATVAGVLIAGPALDNLGPFTSAALALPVAALVIFPTALGWLTERPCTSPPCGLHWGILAQQRRLFLCTVILAAAVVVAAGCAIAAVSSTSQAIVAAVGSIIVSVSSIVLLPAGLWKPLLYMFLASALTINTYGFVDNFYLDAATPEESKKLGYPVCEDCPHFSNTFYVTVVGVCDAVFMSVASWLFNAFMSGWTYRRALVVTQVVVMVVSLIDIIQFQRWNKLYGIPDTVFMIGKHAVQNTCSMLNFMPGAILISKLCPTGVESTVFSLLAGFSNFGLTISWYLGAYVLDWIGLGNIGKGEVDDFRHAWKACLINACTPLTVLCVMPFLIPNARMSAPLSTPVMAEDVVPFGDDDFDLLHRGLATEMDNVVERAVLFPPDTEEGLAAAIAPEEAAPDPLGDGDGPTDDDKQALRTSVLN
eukprot:GGOE01021876.1.p1 GENE.GGOE01021876.1~~GGOE01021876.1.p1  ORF type:complete len:640 (-),score=180.93 GGOE01021876.1:225-2144(-)